MRCCSARKGRRWQWWATDDKVQLRSIVIGRDFGTTMEILGGVETSDRIIINPSDSLEAGQQVHVAPPAQSGPNQTQPNTGSQPFVRRCRALRA